MRIATIHSRLGGGPARNNVVCRYWMMGKCNRNPCRFMHRELPPPNVYREHLSNPIFYGRNNRLGALAMASKFIGIDGSEVKTAQNSTNHVIKDPPRKRPNPGNSLASNSGGGGGGSEYKCTRESSSSGTKAMNLEKIKPSSNSSVLVVEGNASEEKTAVSGIALPSRSDNFSRVVVMEQYMFGIAILAWNIETAAEFNLDGPVGQVNAIAVADVVDMLFAGHRSKPILLCSCSDNTVYLYELLTFIERGRIFSKSEVRTIQTGPGEIVELRGPDPSFCDGAKTVLKESDEEPGVENEKAESAALPPSEGVPETTGKEEPAADGHDAVNTQQASVEDLNTDDAEKKEESEKHSEEDEDPVTDTQTASRKMEVPNDKVGLIIGRGGDAIKALQAKSGARIQLIPQHLPEGDGSKERTVRVTGDRKQIEMAREMIKDVMNQTVRSSPYSGSFNQQHSYRPRGPTGPSNWGPRGPHSSQPNPYDYHLRGPYPSQSSQYPPPSYGGYPPQQMGPEGGHVSDHPASGPISTPVSGHAPSPSPTPAMSHSPSQANYNYGQPHGPDYGHQAPYSQAVPSQQGYGHGYDEPKYDNHAPMQHPYGHGSSQPVYPQASNQPGYRAQQQYGKQPSCGMPLQGPPPQSYGPPRPSQPGDMPYQGPIQSSQSYGPNVPPQQQYPYASSGQSKVASQFHVISPGGQQSTGYVQGPTSGYGLYPSSQQCYPEQPASNNAGYGYQGSQDPAYGSGPGATYSAPPSGQQAYAQPTATQPSYDQSVPQSGAYGAAPGSAPVGYGKNLVSLAHLPSI
ncbi:hypothetical protein GH714_012922 [Hevea brasiliensis]|uniref:C3H1-type domain-containing protein n=1 Tax=Hevea brasiliensis TaxID=3981 RepID=A0A6A6KN73_HEVBR|nr:hypothetical protein GH714_012922 [Hevea brasiliensis]